MVANLSINVNTVMDGKNKSSILITLKSNNAYTVITVRSLTVHITIQIMIEGILYQDGLDISPKQELYLFQLTFMSMY